MRYRINYLISVTITSKNINNLSTAKKIQINSLSTAIINNETNHNQMFNNESLPIGALYIAADNGDINRVKHLVKSGADVNTKNFHGDTLLILASKSGHLDVVKYLVESDADVNAQGANLKMNALHMASSNGYLNVVKYLVKSNADINAKNVSMTTALDLTVMQHVKAVDEIKIEEYNNIIRFLIENGAHSTIDTFENITNETLKNEFIELAASKIEWIEQAEAFLNDPITMELFEDPLIASDGHTYSKSILQKLFDRGNPFSPITRVLLVRLDGSIGIPNIAMKQMVDKYKEHKLKISQGGYKQLN